ncbi:alpha-galactosidase, partial [Streptococcus pyogenes]
ARFDPGMLHYAPQTWTSDDTDAFERIAIQYGTSMVYPLSAMGSHISEVPNQQVHRITPLSTRANVAYFGAFGYELDLSELTEKELEEVKE